MIRRLILSSVLGASSVLMATTAAGGAPAPSGTSTNPASTNPTFTNPTRIDNPYLPITKFHRCVLAGNDQGQRLRIVRTLLHRTQPFTIDGKTVNAVVVHDEVTDVEAKQRIEKTIDYFAQDDAGAVHYLGEDVNEYKHGKLAGHGGQWRYGRDTQTIGTLMPANPTVGDVFRSEDVPGIVTETDTVASSGGTKRIGRRAYRNVIRVREDATPPPEVEFKNYSPGVGVITEANGGVHLVGCARGS